MKSSNKSPLCHQVTLGPSKCCFKTLVISFCRNGHYEVYSCNVRLLSIGQNIHFCELPAFHQITELFRGKLRLAF